MITYAMSPRGPAPGTGGRPRGSKKPAERARSVRVLVSLTPAEAAALRTFAAEHGQSMAAVFREALARNLTAPGERD